MTCIHLRRAVKLNSAMRWCLVFAPPRSSAPVSFTICRLFVVDGRLPITLRTSPRVSLGDELFMAGVPVGLTFFSVQCTQQCQARHEFGFAVLTELNASGSPPHCVQLGAFLYFSFYSASSWAIWGRGARRVLHSMVPCVHHPPHHEILASSPTLVQERCLCISPAAACGRHHLNQALDNSLLK